MNQLATPREQDSSSAVSYAQPSADGIFMKFLRLNSSLTHVFFIELSLVAHILRSVMSLQCLGDPASG